MKSIKVTAGCVLGAMAIGAALAPASYGHRSLFDGQMAVLIHEGLSPTRAREALAVQGLAGETKIASKLEAALGAEFAGVWLEPVAARFTIGFTSQRSMRTAERVVAEAGMKGFVRYVRVRSTWSQLLVAQQEWGGRLAQLFARQEARTGIDPPRNAVSVVISSAVSATERQSIRDEAEAADVNVLVRVIAPARLHVVPRARPSRCPTFVSRAAYCTKTITPGVSISIERARPASVCTAGPLAVRRGTAETYLLTAGHCIEKEGGVGTSWYSSTPAGAEQRTEEIGPATTALNNDVGDYGAIRIEPFFWAEPGNSPVFAGVVRWSRTREVEATAVSGEEASVAGLVNCHEGATSGQQCGRVILVEMQLLREGPLYLVEDFACGEGGDSGGPWINTTLGGELRIDGLESRGEPERCGEELCPNEACASFYQPIQPALLGMNMVLLTRSNETPRPSSTSVLLLGGEVFPVTLSSLPADNPNNKIKSELQSAAGTLKGEGFLLGGSILTATGGLYEALFLDIEEPVARAKCSTVGDKEGEVLLPQANFTVVHDFSPAAGVGLLLEVKEFAVTCGALRIKVKGTALALLQPVGSEVLWTGLKASLRCSRTTGVPGEKAFWSSLLSSELTAKLEANFGAGFRQACEELASGGTVVVDVSKMLELMT
jgi:hypothetical protein